MAKTKKSTKKRSVPRSSILSKTKRVDGGAGQNPIAVRSVSEFERYLEDDKPVIVDFWAPWCGPCKAMAPIFEQVGKQFQGRVHFLKIDTEQLPELAGELGIRSIPTLLVFHGDEITDSNVGLTSEGSLAKLAQRAADKANGVTFGDKVKRLFGASRPAAAAPPAE